jgi:hypothetical protein
MADISAIAGCYHENVSWWRLLMGFGRSKNTADGHLTKFAAAQRQLNAAIRLTLRGEDEVAIHTIAAAAYRILRDIKQKEGRNELADLWALSLFKMANDLVCKTNYELPKGIADSDYLVDLIKKVVGKIADGEIKTAEDLKVMIPIDQQQSHWRTFNASANFLKHADKDSDKSIDIEALDNDTLLLRASAAYIGLMGGEHTPETQAYGLYRFGADPECAEMELYKSDAGVQFRKLPIERRRQFCFRYLQRLMRSSRH